MSAVFAVTPLISGGYLVDGEDAVGTKGSTVLRSEAWDAAEYVRDASVAVDEFDAKVKEFFAPVVEAADKLHAVGEEANEFATVTIGEVVEDKESTTIELDEAGILLNILNQGEFDRLRWVSGELVAVK